MKLPYNAKQHIVIVKEALNFRHIFNICQKLNEKIIFVLTVEILNWVFCNTIKGVWISTYQFYNLNGTFVMINNVRKYLIFDILLNNMFVIILIQIIEHFIKINLVVINFLMWYQSKKNFRTTFQYGVKQVFHGLILNLYIKTVIQYILEMEFCSKVFKIYYAMISLLSVFWFKGEIVWK